jgi:hypothetical protein
MVLPPTYMKPSRASVSGSSAACAAPTASSVAAIANILFMMGLPGAAHSTCEKARREAGLFE